MSEKCLVFLGNPGREYEKTRHNVGFLLADVLETELGQSIQWTAKFNGLVATATIHNSKILLFKPQTFMNLSGEVVRKLSDFYKLSTENFIVIHDDMELNFGEIAFKVNGGSGGHNGLRSLDTHLGNSSYIRCRIGIGRPSHGDSANFILSRFTKDEEISLPVILETASRSLLEMLNGSKQPSVKIQAIPEFKPHKKN